MYAALYNRSRRSSAGGAGGAGREAVRDERRLLKELEVVLI